MAVALSASAAAQGAQAPAGEIAGTVYDSTARTPLRGANVQLVLADNPAGALRTVISDAEGRFRFTDVAAGRYLLGFTHDRLDAFALETPMRIVEVRSLERTSADLGVPAPLTILASMCGPRADADSTGAMIGQIRDARTRLPRDMGMVQAQWTELIIASSGFSIVQHRDSAALRGSGWFVLCNVPGNTELAASAASPPDSTGLVEVAIPARGVLRRDFLMGGTATVRGIVSAEKRGPLADVGVAIAGRERGTFTDSSGAFLFREVTAGSQTLQIRMVGYGAEMRRLELAHGADTTFTIVLTPIKRILDTIRVVGQRVYDRDRSGFQRRRRGGTGYFLDEQQIASRHAFDLFGLLQGTPGIQIRYDGLRRTVTMRGNATGLCRPTVFLDGMRLSNMAGDDLDLFVRPSELAAIEVYRPINVPAEFNTFNSCGAVVMWTATRPRR